MESKIINYKKESLFKTYENINRALKKNPEEIYGSFGKNSGDAENHDTFEQSVRLIVIDHLKSKEGVIAALLSNDLQQIRRALHCKWFFEDALLPDYYKNNIFPHVSFSTRCKIIHQLSRHLKNEGHAEELFEFIQSNYGKNHAMVLLPKCRVDFITSYVKDSEVIFPFVVWRIVLLKLLPKYPQIVLDILEGWCNNDSPLFRSLSKCKKIFLYIAKHHPDLFIPFYEKHYSFLSFIHFGDKLRRSLSPALLDIVFKSDKPMHRKMFNNQNLFRELDFQGKVYFLSKLISPKKESSFSCWNSNLREILSLVKPKTASERAELLAAVFQHVFGENLWEHPEVWSVEMLKLMPLEIREKCVSVLSGSKEFKDFCSNKTSVDRNIGEQLAYLLDCKNSIPKLKEMIKKMPFADDRKIVLLEMVKSCAINKDLESLCTVCNYIKNRHRNEDIKIILSVLRSIEESFDSRKFDLKLWTVLEELLTMGFVAERPCHFTVCTEMIEKYAFFRLRNNLDPKEQIKILVKNALSSDLIFYFDFKFINDVRLPFAKIYFQMYYDELMIAVKEGNLRRKDMKIICKAIVDTMNKYNAHHVDDKIISVDLKGFTSFLDHLIDLYEKDKNDDYDTLKDLVTSVISKDPHLKLKYKELCEKFCLPSIFELLKKNPNDVLKDHENLFDRFYDDSDKYFEFFKRNYHRKDLFFNNIYFWKKIFDFYNASEGFKNHVRERFKELDLQTSFMKKQFALIVFSHFTDISEYEECVQDYIPENKEIDYKNNSFEFLQIQAGVAAVIKNIKPDLKNFHLIFKFLMGDYLKYVLDSLNSACYNSPPEIVIKNLTEKIETPVSVKKAIIRNISAVSTLEEKIKFCNGLWEKEKHDSIRSVIFKRILDIFTDKPTEETFNSVKKCILESSEVTIGVRLEVKKIPPRFRDKYVNAIWDFANGITENDSLKNKIKNSVIAQFNIRMIKMLSDKLCEEMINSEIFIDDSGIAVNDFTCCYIFHDSDSMERKLVALLDLMRERKKNFNAIAAFIRVFEGFSFKHSKHSCELFNLILQTWPSIFEKHELYDEFLTLQYYKIYHEILMKEETKDVLSITIKFVDELKNIIKTTPNYQELLNIFKPTLEKFINDTQDSNCRLNRILLIRLLISPPEKYALMLGAFLLTKNELKESESKTEESEGDSITLDKKRNIKYIYNALKNCKDEVFQIYYFRKFDLK